MTTFSRSHAAPIERFIPRPDVRERHEVNVAAPAALVLDVARHFSLQSIPAVRAIFWLRSKALGSHAPATWKPEGIVAETLKMGWGTLAEEAGRCYVAGAACQPWQADVVFSPIPPDEFAAFAEPYRVKIAWTLETDPLEPALTRLATETRAVATDAAAREQFRRYWRSVRIGIVTIRWLLLPGVRREAERQWRAMHAAELSPR